MLGAVEEGGGRKGWVDYYKTQMTGLAISDFRSRLSEEAKALVRGGGEEKEREGNEAIKTASKRGTFCGALCCW